MITKFDDFPIHQTPDPIVQSATSDRFTYDRYWYNGHSRDGSIYFGIAMGRYPNLGILDCAFSVVCEGRQYAFFGSRRAPQEPTETVVGPFSIQILEPMGRHRVRLCANETGIECDLVFTPRTAAIQEGRQTKYNARHLVQDVTRFDQFGSWEGSIRCNHQTVQLEPGSTLGLKDRSWGIRQVGARYTGGAPLQEKPCVHFMWAPIHWDDRCTLAGLYEDGDGYQWHTDQAIAPVYASPTDIPAGVDPGLAVWKGRVEHQLQLIPGTRQAKSATIRMQDRSGASLELVLEPVALFRMKGIGYQHPEWGHGAWKGELAIGSESWDCDSLDPLTWENLHVQQLVRARYQDQIGYGVLEQMHIGPCARYQLEGWTDGAKEA